MRKWAIRPAPPSVILAFSPPVILAFSLPVILDISPPVILDISNRGSSIFVFGIRSPASDAANGKRHPMAPPPGASGRGCAPVPKPIGWRGLSERSEFRSPSNRDWGTGTPLGPRPGAHGFGSFCRNKRTSARGAETPQTFPRRRAGPKPRDAAPALRKSSASLRAGSVRDLRWRGGRAGESPRRRGEARRWPGVDTSAPPRRSAGRSARAGPTSGFAPRRRLWYDRPAR